MASPFSVFRKNKKVMFAILTLMAILAFVFLPLLNRDYSGRGPADRVVVHTTKYGDLRESNLQYMRQRREKVRLVFQSLLQQPEVLKQWQVQPSQLEQFIQSVIGPAGEESIINSWLLARRADELGIVITDEAINRYLAGMTKDVVPKAEIEAAFKRAGISDLLFFDAMREILAAYDLRIMFSASLEGLTPGQRWDYFKRVNQLAKVEAVSVPVAQFVGGIGDPGNAELEKFFEEHKEQYALADSPEPGFHEPKRVALEYFTADMGKFMAEVTDEEIQRQYEKNKPSYDAMEKRLEAAKEEAKKQDIGKAPEAQTKPAETKPAEIKPAETKPAEIKPAEVKPAETKLPAKSSEPVKQPAPAAEKKKAGDTSAVVRPSPFRLTALVSEEKSSDEKKPAEKSPPAATKDAEAAKPKAEPKAEVKAGPKLEAKAEQKAPPKVAETPAPQKPEPKAAAKTPTAGLSDVVKQRIRQNVANEKITEIFEKLKAPMLEYQRKWVEQIRMQKRSPASGGSAESLPPPDLAALAKQNGLTVGRMPLMAQWEAADTEIGATYVGMAEPVSRYAFSSLGMFYPAESSGMMKGYLFWKIEETKDKVPKLTDEGVRDRVVAAWKTVQARPLALEKAQSLAAESDKSRKPLKDIAGGQPDLRVITPASFSWMTFGSVPLGSAGGARIGKVEGVELPGDEFMRAVFSAMPGQSAAAFNAPKTNAYAIRVLEFMPTEETLWNRFKDDDFSKYFSIVMEDHRKTMQAWIDEIKNGAGFVWERKAAPADHNSQAED